MTKLEQAIRHMKDVQPILMIGTEKVASVEADGSLWVWNGGRVGPSQFKAFAVWIDDLTRDARESEAGGDANASR